MTASSSIPNRSGGNRITGILALAVLTLLSSGACASPADVTAPPPDSQTDDPPDSGDPDDDDPGNAPPTAGLAVWTDRCQGQGTMQFTHAPLDPGSVSTVEPLGTLADAHVTPIDHLYIYPSFDNPAADAYPVFVMADAYIKRIDRRVVGRGTADEKEEFRIVMQHTCTFFTYMDLVRVLSNDIMDAFPQLAVEDHATGHHFVEGGREIGRIGGQSLDVAAYNLDKPLTGFITPSLYDSEFWKIYTDDAFFEYFSPNIRAALLALNHRTAEPRAGKIDHDRPGRLMGNWFEEGTNGYAGVANEQSVHPGRGYWSTHLSFVPDAYQPQQMKLSIGDFNNEALQFSVKGNGPGFADVDANDGVVQYELIRQKIFNSDDPVRNQMNEDDGPVLGIVLVEVLAGERIRFEVFPGAQASHIESFTAGARIYER